MKILISACLAGVNCRYDGGSMIDKEILERLSNEQLIPVCPEQLGGLPTPRIPVELVSDKAINLEGTDVTCQMRQGAGETLKIAKLCGCQFAILKENSPSCGTNFVYNGHFSGKRIPGKGITGQLLIENGIIVMNEENYLEIIQKIKMNELSKG